MLQDNDHASGLAGDEGRKVPKADPNTRTGSGGTVLHQVSGRGYADIIALLLKHGAEVNTATAYGRAPLHQAAGGGSIERVRLLLAAGADFEVTDMSYCTLRDLAEQNNHYHVAGVLLDAEKGLRVHRDDS